MSADEFRAVLAAEFPELVVTLAEYGAAGLLHCEVGNFLRATEDAIDGGRRWLAERHFRFVERARRDADGYVRNALEVSYLEGLAFGERTPERHRVVKERMPKALRQRLIDVHGWWA